MDRIEFDQRPRRSEISRPQHEPTEFRRVTPADQQLLAELFAELDSTFFRPHPLTAEAAAEIARRTQRDIHAMLIAGGRPVAYGMLRGWDEGFTTPSLGLAVRTGDQGRGYGRAMMEYLGRCAMEGGAPAVRLRVHADNVRARRLYESLGYTYQGEDRGELVMTLDLTREAG